MKLRRLLPLFLLLIAAPAAAQAPQVPGATMTVTWDSVTVTDCQGQGTEEWLLVYGPPPCYQPTGTTAGQPFITSVRLTSTPSPQTTPATTPLVTTVPRAQVTRLTDAAACSPRPAPCLRTTAPSLTIPVAVEVALLDGEGRVAATTVPFSGASRPRPPTAPTVSIR